jgi:hypothetical protein
VHSRQSRAEWPATVPPRRDMHPNFLFESVHSHRESGAGSPTC